MIKIEFQDQTYNIPSQWSDMSLSEYEQWFDHKPQNKREYVELVADICKMDADLLFNSPRQLFDIIGSTISFVFDTELEPAQSVEINDTNYHIAWSDELTLGEWVDIDAVLASDSTTKVSDILAIVCRPLGEEYDPKLGDTRRESFRTLSCDKALPLLAFFLHRKKQSDEILSHCSNLLLQANQYLRDTKDFVKNGDGIKRLPIWQRIRYNYLIRSLEKQLSRYSDFSFTR